MTARPTPARRYLWLAPLAVALAAVGIALPEPTASTDDVCAMAVAAARSSIDRFDASGQGDETSTGPLGGATPEQARAIVAAFDFDLLARSVPTSLRADVVVMRRYAEDLVAGADVSADELATSVRSILAITQWLGDTCP